MVSFLKLIIWFLIIFATYHLVRDFSQDILKLHNPITDTFNLRPIRQEHFLGKYFRFWSYPLEIILLFLTFKSIQDNHFGLIGSLAVGVFATFISLWAWTSFK